MANETPEPRALSAALAAPAFTTRGAGVAMHVANRHVERWAPEAGANRVRPLRSLGFVDRLVAPWIETAQRSAGLRMFSQYVAQDASQREREGGAVSWVFPRPWYQDELDWMAASRQVGATVGREAAPAMFTTRGTYVAPTRSAAAAPQTVLPTALYEYIAPSLSVARPAAPMGVGHGGTHADAYSPLVSLAAVQAAELMSRAVAPLVSSSSTTAGAAPGRMTPALRTMLTTMLARAATTRSAPSELAPTRLSMYAPELVTPPAPRPAQSSSSSSSSFGGETAYEGAATQLAEQYQAQRTQVVELQRIAQKAAERELASRPAPQAAPVPASTAVSATEVAAAQRTEVELRQRAAEARQAANATSASTAAAERARLEERIAQRVAERTTTQRLHEQARTEAATHARAADLAAIATAAASAAAPSAASVPSVALDQRRAPAEVAAAMAALPPELAQFLGQRPGRGMQAIGELSEALRTVELMARTAASGAAFETTRGPRLVMPAGMGGLVAAVDRAQSISDRPAMLTGARPASVPAPLSLGSEARAAAPAFAPSMVTGRVPSLPWITGPRDRARATTSSAAPTTAFGAATASPPAALTHVAWADRWLARFAGASPQSLGVLTAASATSHRMEALVAAAPGAVFVAPMFDVERVPGMRFDAEGRQVAAPAAMPMVAGTASSVSSPSASASSSSGGGAAGSASSAIERFDDAAETPDDVFAQIAAAATRSRATAVQSSSAAAASSTAASAASASSAGAAANAPWAPADAIAHAAPVAPGAGLSAQLASSPFAAALRHLLPLPSAASFDVRSLFGSSLSATYLAGLLGSSSHELEVASTGPSWIGAYAGLGATAGIGATNEMLPAATRAALEWDPAYVAAEPPTRDMRDARTESALSSSMHSEGVAFSPAAAAAAAAPLTTLRTALLSWNVDAAMPTFADAPTVVGASQTAPITTSTARAMIEAMSMPMLGDVANEPSLGSGWTAPGMVGERAHGWAVAQERSSSDLSLDFVTPELVLAARVYGLGPAEAAQAARLAIAGPGQLSAMASTVDRTFVQAMAIEADRRSAEGSSAARAAAITTAYPTASGEIAATLGPVPSRGTEASAAPGMAAAPSLASAPGSAFGVDRRAPRGAFLWPAATVAALGMNAASPDSQQSMSVAALELLAAQAVAEIGTFAALSDHHADRDGRGDVTGESEGTSSSARTTSRSVSSGAPAFVSSSGSSTSSSATDARDLREPGESEVLAAAAALVPSSRRARFDALYVSLSQSSNGKTWSPAARAARALALAGRGDDAPLSARDRAASAWDVLPVVYATDGSLAGGTGDDAGPRGSSSSSAGRSPGSIGSRSRTGAGRTTGRPGELVAADDGVISVDGRPGLGALSARAGEALGSYVTPTVIAPSHASSSAPSQRHEAMSPAMRAPTAAQELVRTGRPSGRYGGGEVEIPTWFEAAARKMFDDRSGSSDSGISMSELTLVTAAPSTHIAASSRGAAAPVTPATGSAHGPSAHAPQIDIEKVANEVYRQILVLMDASRARNGEPYL